MRFAACVAAATVAVLAGAAQAAAPNGRIGYLRPLGGNEPPYGHLFAVNPDGSGATDLTPAGYTDVRSFAWSPNGRQIAFSALKDGETEPPESFAVSAAGRPVRRLANNPLPDLRPGWAPAGRLLS